VCVRVRVCVCAHVCVCIHEHALCVKASFLGSLKSWVSFAKEPYKKDDILSRALVVMCVKPSFSQGLVYRVAYCHRMPYLYRSFSAKEPYN